MGKHLLIFGMVLGLLSCSNDDDGVSLGDRNEALFGQWEYEAIESDTAVDINGDGTVNIDLYNTNEIRQCLKDNLTFFSDGPADEGKDLFTQKWRVPLYSLAITLQESKSSIFRD